MGEMIQEHEPQVPHGSRMGGWREAEGKAESPTSALATLLISDRAEIQSQAQHLFIRAVTLQFFS